MKITLHCIILMIEKQIHFKRDDPNRFVYLKTEVRQNSIEVYNWYKLNSKCLNTCQGTSL